MGWKETMLLLWIFCWDGGGRVPCHLYNISRFYFQLPSWIVGADA